MSRHGYRVNAGIEAVLTRYMSAHASPVSDAISRVKGASAALFQNDDFPNMTRSLWVGWLETCSLVPTLAYN